MLNIILINRLKQENVEQRTLRQNIHKVEIDSSNELSKLRP
jgi:hypothetical protein